MLQKLSPWLAAGFTTGLVILLGLWLLATTYFHTLLLGQRPLDPRLVATVIETSLTNPEIQTALKNQIIVYLRSPEGKARMAETLRSPEMVKALAENIHSPEMRTAILKLMEIPEFRAAVLDIVKDTPEMRMLNILSQAIILDPPPAATSPYE